MSTNTRADAGDLSAAAPAQKPVEGAGLGSARLTDIAGLKTPDTNTYVRNDGFQIADNSPTATTAAQRLQEFVDGFGHLGYLYSNASLDQGRFEKFQGRMQTVYGFDKETFKDLGKLGDGLVANPPTSPEDTGKKLADIMSDTLKRHPGDQSNPAWKELETAIAGVMVAATSTFKPGTKAEQTTAMVDSMDAQLRKNNVPLRAIVWGDNGEPGLLPVVPGKPPLSETRRHHYLE